jgi:hypothetical protein
MVDEAATQGSSVDDNDFKRGRRFKKLYAVLSSAVVSGEQRPAVSRSLAGWLAGWLAGFA